MLKDLDQTSVLIVLKSGKNEIIFPLIFYSQRTVICGICITAAASNAGSAIFILLY